MAGMANMSVTLAATVIQDSVEGVVSEIFWAVVDVVGLGCYFRNVARYKQRYDAGLPARDAPDPDADTEEVCFLCILLYGEQRRRCHGERGGGNEGRGNSGV